MSSKRKKILIVDDEPDILDLIQYNLENDGYEVTVANNGIESIEKAKADTPDLVLLDVMMPEMDGMETCTRMRELEELDDTIIAFLTARSEDYSQIAGFDAGADDYITKPIKPRALLRRIKALLKRKKHLKEDLEKENVKSIYIDKDKYVVVKDGKEIGLPKKEFKLLALLMSKPGRVFTREVILDNIWGNDVVVGDRTIDVHIRKLREKIGDEFIKTIKGVGYKFEE